VLSTERAISFSEDAIGVSLLDMILAPLLMIDAFYNAAACLGPHDLGAHAADL
jgi:hypothetical protein